MATRLRRRLARLALVGATLLVTDQVLQHTVLADGLFLKVRVAPFDPPLFSARQRKELARAQELLARGESGPRFDALLGWCPRPGGGDALYRYDWAGSREGGREHLRDLPDGTRRVVALGCSFTRGDEVPGDQAWPWLVSAAGRGVEVANLGMGGYGLDQAYLRYLQDGRALAADEVWVGWLPRATLRITTHFPPLLSHWSTAVAFKPRFLLDDDGSLRLVPTPAASLADFVRLLSDQHAFLAGVGESDLWVRRSPRAYAPAGSSWLHHLAAGRLLLTWDESRGRALEPWLRDEDGEVRRLFLAILRQLREAVLADGARLRVLVLPGRDDLFSRARLGHSYWQGVAGDLEAEGFDLLDLTPLFEARRAREAGHLWMPGGHYSAEGNRIVAEGIARHWLEP